MLTEILSVAFLVGVPIWLVVEHVLHRSHIRAKAARLIEVRRPGRRTVAADRLTHAAWPLALRIAYADGDGRVVVLDSVTHVDARRVTASVRARDTPGPGR